MRSLSTLGPRMEGATVSGKVIVWGWRDLTRASLRHPGLNRATGGRVGGQDVSQDVKAGGCPQGWAPGEMTTVAITYLNACCLQIAMLDILQTCVPHPHRDSKLDRITSIHGQRNGNFIMCFLCGSNSADRHIPNRNEIVSAPKNVQKCS